VVDTECHKEEMLKLIMEKNLKIREMESEMDKLIKEKETNANMAMIPLEVALVMRIRTTESSTST
jgi:hypothetical protein